MHNVSCLYLKNIIKICIMRGADPDEIYSHIKGGKETLENTSLRIDGEVCLDILKSAVLTSGEPRLALKVGESLRPDSLDDLGYAVTFCDNLREAIHMISKYQCISQNFGKTSLKVEPGAAKILWTSIDSDAEKYGDYVDLVLAGYATVGRWLLWHSDSDLYEVELRRSRPDDVRGYIAAFGPNLKFGAVQDALIFNPALVDVALPNRNPDIKRLMKRRLDVQMLSIHETPSTTYRVRRCITSELPKGRPEIEKIAQILGQSERTLRRNLSKEGTRFRDVLITVYKEACEIHLRDESHSHAQIALMLGFSDQTAYSRAFKRWFKMSPEAYRKTIAAVEEGAFFVSV